jgi:uncharacterized membrane protein (TIGR01666 family)
MDYVKEYKRFINSHYLNGAIRITVGITLPAILLGYFNNLSVGIVVSIGAMCVGNTDNPGPIHHRRNGMMACVLIIFLVSLLTGLASGSAVLTGLLLLLFCFLFSLMGIYGNRAGSIGVNALLVMVLSLDRRQQGWAILINAVYVLAGGLWYTALSLLLYSFRPYKLVQQALGDCVQATAGYLRIKASFYSREVDYDKSYRQLLESQVAIQGKEDLLRELIFKSRKIVKESTNTGRILMMIFLDSIDLFERIMTSQQDYRLLHRFFDDSQLMEECRKLILDLASELDEIGLAIMSGKPSVDRSTLSVRIRQLRATLLSNYTEGVADLSNILDSIQDINDRLHVLHGFTTYDRKLSRSFRSDMDYEQFVAHQDMDRKLILDNLTLDSNIFRHSLRVSVATIAGYIISRFLPFGHGYWILLTIIVILKPAYSLTKKRNFERLMGTLGGALAGLVLIYFIRDKTALFVLMILFMIGTYVFLRTNYLVSVILMTPYVLLLFHLLYPANFHSVITDRVIDTLIGSGISFLASIFIIPSWEHEGIIDYMTAALKTNIAYFSDVAGAFTGSPVTVQQYKLSRRHAFVALANLSDAFARMLSEPRGHQKETAAMHQFVVFNHMLTSYIATLAYYEKPLAAKYADPAFQPVVYDIARRLGSAVVILGREVVGRSSGIIPAEASLKNKILAKGEERTILKPVEDQFSFIAKVSEDIYKLSFSLHEALMPEDGETS